VEERSVRLHLLVRRFRCVNRRCPRRTFAESYPKLVMPYAQRTIRLREVQCELGLVVGGELGSCLMTILHMPTSPDTVF
jgi:hypothetical protein